MVTSCYLCTTNRVGYEIIKVFKLKQIVSEIKYKYAYMFLYIMILFKCRSLLINKLDKI